jgi:hypothetical protein
MIARNTRRAGGSPQFFNQRNFNLPKQLDPRELKKQYYSTKKA